MAVCEMCGEVLRGDQCPACLTTTMGAELGGPHSADEPIVPVKPGDVLEGKWRVEGRLGHGGMGVVMKAHDLTLDRPVAIKLLADSLLADEDARERFEREARLTARLKHPNIVTVHATGRHQGRPFIVMEFLEGVPLSKVLRANPRLLSMSEMVAVTRQICSGLDFIHARGFVHRDVKPSNIFVSPDGHATLLDFGISQAPQARALTQVNQVLGTRGFIAPEVLRGQKADARSDVFAMGAVTYQMLAGVPPSALPSQSASADFLNAPIVSLSVTAPQLDQSVSWVVMRALCFEPNRRYDSAGDFARALSEATTASVSLDPSRNSSRQPSHTQPVSAQRRKRLAFLAAGSIGLGLLGFIVWSVSTPTVPQPVIPSVVSKAVSAVPAPVVAAASVPSPEDAGEVEIGRVQRAPSRRILAARHEKTATAVTKKGRLRVVSVEHGKPTWALVEVDGAPHGGTPLEVEVVAGLRRLRVTRDGFRTIEQSVQVEAGKLSVARMELTPLAP